MSAVENTLAATTFIAFARNYMVEVGGKQMSLWDAYEKSNTGGDFSKLEDPVGEDVILDFQMKLGRLQRHMQGSYGSLDKTLMSRVWYMAAVEWMRKWLVSTIDRLYGKERFNTETGEVFEGYYRTVGRLLKQATKDMVEFKQLNNKQWNNLSPDEINAVRFVRTQMGMIALVKFIIWGLQGDDDDIEEMPAYQAWMLHSLYKGNREFQALVAPWGADELLAIVKNPVPQLLPFYEPAVKVFKNIDYDPFDDEPFFVRYKTDTANSVGEFKEGDLKMYYTALSTLGLKQSKIDPTIAYENLKAINLR